MLRRGPLLRGAVSVFLSRRLLGRAMALAIGTAVVLPALAPASLPITSRAWAASHLVITSDNAGGPLVSAANLAPGTLPPTCLKISYTGAVAGDELRLFVSAGGSGLADYLDVTIEQGQGGIYGDCSGFSGTRSYRGTLATLGRDHGTELTALLIAPFAAGAGDVSLRLTFSVRSNNQAQGSSATADFTWVAGSGFGPPVVPPVVPSPSPSSGTTGGGTTGGGTTGGGTTGGGTTGGGTTGGGGPHVQRPTLNVPLLNSPAPSHKASTKPSTTATTPPAAVGPRHVKPAKAPFASFFQRLWNAIKKLSTPLITGASIGLGILPFIIVFLLIQHRIDMRDPKLALAPSYAEPDLGFGDTPLGVPA